MKTTKDVNKIKFWRTQDKKEIDFVVGNEAFEIKFNLREEKEGKYKQFKSFYPDIKLKFLTYDELLEKFYHWKL